MNFGSPVLTIILGLIIVALYLFKPEIRKLLGSDKDKKS